MYVCVCGGVSDSGLGLIWRGWDLMNFMITVYLPTYRTHTHTLTWGSNHGDEQWLRFWEGGGEFVRSKTVSVAGKNKKSFRGKFKFKSRTSNTHKKMCIKKATGEEKNVHRSGSFTWAMHKILCVFKINVWGINKRSSKAI